MKKDERFCLECQYQKLLEKLNLKEEDLHEVQKTVMRDTYFGAIGQLLVTCRDDLSQLPEDEAVDMMQSMLNQTKDYFDNKKPNPNYN